MGIKISYHVTERLTFSGTVEVDEAEYEAMRENAAAGENRILGDLILDCIDQNNPQAWEIDSVDVFEKVE